MKIFKFVAAVIALIAMTFSFSSCSRELDPDNPNDGKGWYRCEIAIDHAGSLTEEQQTLLSNTIDVTIGLDKNEAHPYTFIHEADMRTNYNKIVALSASENDIIQKIIVPVANTTGVKDFTVKFVFQHKTSVTNSEGQTEDKVDDLQTVVYKASDYVQ